jgi:hypothetical protein
MIERSPYDAPVKVSPPTLNAPNAEPSQTLAGSLTVASAIDEPELCCVVLWLHWGREMPPTWTLAVAIVPAHADVTKSNMTIQRAMDAADLRRKSSILRSRDAKSRSAEQRPKNRVCLV